MAMTLLVGGARSGKSSLAVRMAEGQSSPVVFIATGQPSDAEMAERIARHQAERPSHWRTIEVPRDVAGALAGVDPAHFVILDCLTLWTANLLEEDDATIPEVTAAMLTAIRSGAATSSVLARAVGAEMAVVDAGVGRPSADFTLSPALTDDEFAACFQQGREAAAGLDCDLLAIGEMGIGNSTSAAAIAAAVIGGDAAGWAGPGSGASGEVLENKRRAVAEGVRRIGEGEPLEALRQLGGGETAALAGRSPRPGCVPCRCCWTGLFPLRRSSPWKPPRRGRWIIAWRRMFPPNPVIAACWNGWGKPRCWTWKCGWGKDPGRCWPSPWCGRRRPR